MNRKLLVFVALLVLVLFTAGGALARLAGYSLPWWTVDSGGGVASGGSYQLSGTIGQPDAGTLSGGNYQLEGGFWGRAGGAISPLRVYLPLTTKP